MLKTKVRNRLETKQCIFGGIFVAIFSYFLLQQWFRDVTCIAKTDYILYFEHSGTTVGHVLASITESNKFKYRKACENWTNFVSKRLNYNEFSDSFGMCKVKLYLYISGFSDAHFLLFSSMYIPTFVTISFTASIVFTAFAYIFWRESCVLGMINLSLFLLVPTTTSFFPAVWWCQIMVRQIPCQFSF